MSILSELNECINDIEDKILELNNQINLLKKTLSNVQMHPNGESVSSRATSFNISLADFVSFFNRQQSILLKNIPNGFLTDYQIEIKEKVII